MLLAPSPVLEPIPPDYAGAIVTLQHLGELLDASRKRLGLTASVQAQQIGVSQKTLTTLSSVDAKPSFQTTILALRWLVVFAP